jgi:hypothetical protein
MKDFTLMDCIHWGILKNTKNGMKTNSTIWNTSTCQNKEEKQTTFLNINIPYWTFFLSYKLFVVTLTLGSQSRQGFAKGRAKRKTRECGRLWEWTLTLPKWTPMLGIGVPVDSWIFRERLQGSKALTLRRSLYHWKAMET